MTQRLLFYHGTSVLAAANILSAGSRNVVDEMGWRALASEIWRALLDNFGTAEEVSRHHWQHEDLLNGPGLTPLRSAFAQEEGHLFIYGPFFATLNIGCAYRYAIRNPFRSELLHAIADGLKFLEWCGGSAQKGELERRHPTILELINSPSPPVVLELAGIQESRLLNQDGGTQVAQRVELYLSVADKPGVDDPASFRIREISPGDIIAVHDLREWSAADVPDPPWQPDRDRVAAARMDAKEWLSQNRHFRRACL